VNLTLNAARSFRVQTLGYTQGRVAGRSSFGSHPSRKCALFGDAALQLACDGLDLVHVDVQVISGSDPGSLRPLVVAAAGSGSQCARHSRRSQLARAVAETSSMFAGIASSSERSGRGLIPSDCCDCLPPFSAEPPPEVGWPSRERSGLVRWRGRRAVAHDEFRAKFDSLV
jgi:hypothetical protein